MKLPAAGPFKRGRRYCDNRCNKGYVFDGRRNPQRRPDDAL